MLILKHMEIVGLTDILQVILRVFDIIPLVTIGPHGIHSVFFYSLMQVHILILDAPFALPQLIAHEKGLFWDVISLIVVFSGCWVPIQIGAGCLWQGCNSKLESSLSQ